MAVNERAEIEKVVGDHLDKIALRDKGLAGFSVGPAVAPVPGPGGMAMDVVWLVIVTLPGLLGQPKIAKGTPVPGGRPPDTLLKMATEKMLEACRDARDQLMRVTPGD